MRDPASEQNYLPNTRDFDCGNFCILQQSHRALSGAKRVEELSKMEGRTKDSLAMKSANPERLLIVRTGTRICAFPLRNVMEVMRPLPTDPLPGMPSFLMGLAVIRGGPVPVIDLARLVGAPSSGPANRYVVLRLDERRVAIAAEDVPGIREFGDSVMWGLSSLLEEANPAVVTAVSVNDQHLLFVLQAARIVSDELWLDLERATATP